MNLSSIGFVGRGFPTEISPAYSLPLDKTNCTACGLCVQLCPTGALTEKSVLKKQVPLNEKYSVEEIELDGQKAKVLVGRYDGKVIRVAPFDEVSRKSNATREELLSKLK